jgi:hypothetical protein
MVGGEPLACRDAVARAGGAGPGGLAPSVYGHGRDAVGQLCDNSLQSASLWGVMGAPGPIASTTGANVETFARFLVDGSVVLSKDAVCELLFGYVPLAVLDAAGQAAIDLALGRRLGEPRFGHT